VTNKLPERIKFAARGDRLIVMRWAVRDGSFWTLNAGALEALDASDPRSALTAQVSAFLARTRPFDDTRQAGNFQEAMKMLGCTSNKQYQTTVREATVECWLDRDDATVIEFVPRPEGGFQEGERDVFPRSDVQAIVDRLLMGLFGADAGSAGPPGGAAVAAVAAETRAPFGHKTGWVAARGVEPSQVAEALGLLDPRPETWSAGVEAAYDLGVFVCPVVDGWVLAMGIDILVNTPDIAQLSATLGAEVQLFKSHRVSESHHWSRAQNGVVVRAFEFSLDGGELIVNTGPPTPIEADTPEIAPALASQPGEFPFSAYESAHGPADHPDEGSVMTVAAAWSLDPTQLAGDDARFGVYSERTVRSTPPPSSKKTGKKWRLK
jgi:hypothetical protein